MNFSPEWDERYRRLEQPSVWPWSDLIGFVMRHARPQAPGWRVLELGCGAGANIPFFKSLGVDYFGIEGSPAVVARVWERFPDLVNNVAKADFTTDIPFFGDFDLIVDRSSLTHNSTAAIVACLRLVRARLKTGGRFVGLDWFSTRHDESLRGRPAEDDHTRTGYAEGVFAGVGRVHFSDRPHLEGLFHEFELVVLEHKTIDRMLPPPGGRFASWNLVASGR